MLNNQEYADLFAARFRRAKFQAAQGKPWRRELWKARPGSIFGWILFMDWLLGSDFPEGEG